MYIKFNDYKLLNYVIKVTSARIYSQLGIDTSRTRLIIAYGQNEIEYGADYEVLDIDTGKRIMIISVKRLSTDEHAHISVDMQ